MDGPELKRLNESVDRLLNRLNSAMSLPTASTAQTTFKEVPVSELTAMLADAREVVKAVRGPLRSGVEELAAKAHGVLCPTGLGESLDLHGVRHLQVEHGTTPSGRNVLYVHGDGVTRLRVSGWDSLQIRGGGSIRASSRPNPDSNPDPETDPERFDESTGPMT